MARPKIKPDFKEENLGINPFIQTLVIPIVSKLLEGQYRIDSDGIKVPVELEMEYTPYCKLYSTSGHRKIISNLTSNSSKLLLWIMYDIKHGKDYLWINKHRFMEENKVSINTFKKSLLELQRYAIIVPSPVKEVYWINPEYFFKGSRVNKYAEKVDMVV